MAHGILPWLDQWAAAVFFVDGEGIGPCQRQELDGFLTILPHPAGRLPPGTPAY